MKHDGQQDRLNQHVVWQPTGLGRLSATFHLVETRIGISTPNALTPDNSSI